MSPRPEHPARPRFHCRAGTSLFDIDSIRLLFQVTHLFVCRHDEAEVNLH
jgi:hypothetical protein